MLLSPRKMATRAKKPSIDFHFTNQNIFALSSADQQAKKYFKFCYKQSAAVDYVWRISLRHEDLLKLKSY